MIRWAILWRAKNRIDGERSHFVTDAGFLDAADPCCPAYWLFNSREEARDFITDRFGYLRHRPDLRREPHGWRMPVPVKVRVELLPL